MNLSINLKDVLFLDIETVPQKEKWQQLSKETQALYEKKTRYQRKEEFTAESFYDRAGIWAEFGKIVCISVGYFITSLERKQFRLTSFYGDDEHAILTDFKALLASHFVEKSKLLCAHNGKEFDAYICMFLMELITCAKF
jgi:hypothetical protein